MSVRLLQLVLGVANCIFGLLLLERYGGSLVSQRAWPPSLEEQAIFLVAVILLPLAILGLRFPLLAGIAQFATAFIGNQLLHDSPFLGLRAFSSISMAMSMAILLLEVFRGILEVTQEAFGEIEDQDEKRAADAA